MAPSASKHGPTEFAPEACPVMLRMASSPHAPAPASSAGPQFRKNLWPLRNLRPKLSFWGSRQSFRNWCPAGDTEAGAWGRDEIRDATGTAAYIYGAKATGVFSFVGTSGAFSVNSGSAPWKTLGFSLSDVVPTGPQNVPQHVWQPLALYLGRPA